MDVEVVRIERLRNRQSEQTEQTKQTFPTFPHLPLSVTARALHVLPCISTFAEEVTYRAC
jgi:hypothetical protein